MNKIHAFIIHLLGGHTRKELEEGNYTSFLLGQQSALLTLECKCQNLGTEPEQVAIGLIGEIATRKQLVREQLSAMPEPQN